LNNIKFKSPKSIIYISNGLFPSRSANSKQIMEMCNAFANKGVSVSLTGRRANSNDEIIKFYNVNPKIKFLLIKSSSYSINVFNYLKRFNSIQLDANCIIYSRYLVGLLIFRLYYGNKNILIHESHAAPTFKRRLIEKMLFSSLCFLVVITKSLKNYYETKYNSFLNILVLADAARLLNNPNLKVLHSNNSNINVGYVGSIHKGKGVDIIIKIALKLKDINFHIIGSNITSFNTLYPEYGHIPNFQNIYFYDFVLPCEVSGYFNIMDILLLPNQTKILINKKQNIGQWTSPLKLFEYMSARKPIIASNVKVLREVLKNKYNCLLVNPTDIDEWSKAIMKLSSDQSLAGRISNTAYSEFKKKYTWQIRVNKIITYTYNNN
jgi:glycosyltransferase involved in cell wall biosynthesis